MAEQTPYQGLSTLTTRFSIDLFRTLVEQDRTGNNVVISPLGIATALAMTCNGATGETRQAMAGVLGAADLSIDKVNLAYQDIQGALASIEDGAEVRLVNSLWGNQQVEFKPGFLARASAVYHARLSSLDFGDPASVDIVNQWIGEQTNGRVKKLVDQIDPLTVLLLINATVFKAAWLLGFEERQTRPADFSLPDGKQKPVRLMQSWDSQSYFETGQCQAVMLPYRSERMAMLIVLPREGIALAELVAGLTPGVVEQWMGQFAQRQMHLGLPQFKAAYSQRLNGALTAMGMGIAFDRDRATFDEVADLATGLYISEVKHEAHLIVDEHGTEAVAATMVREMTRSAMSQPTPMIVNRPFLSAIVDQQTGTLLFLGAINNPESPGADS